MDIKSSVKDIPEGKMKMSLDFAEYSQYFAIISTLLVLLITFVFLFFKLRKSSQKIVLLSGLSYSGKTLLFARLVYSKYFESCTSLKENVGSFNYEKKDVKIVDIPGDDRLRTKFFDKYKSSAKGIVYIIDSATVQKTLRDVAELLYQILSDVSVQSNKVKILICCNKQDQTLAKSCNVIKTLLQKELNLVRVTKSNQLSGISDNSSNVPFLGNPDKDFEFSDLPNNITFCDSTGFSSNEDCDVQQLQEWMASL